VHGGKGQRGGAAARLAHEMEAVETVNIGLTQDPLHLKIETEVRRRLIPRVNLEILQDSIDALPQQLQQCRIRGFRRQYPARQQHDVIASHHGRIVVARRNQTLRPTKIAQPSNARLNPK